MTKERSPVRTILLSAALAALLALPAFALPAAVPSSSDLVADVAALPDLARFANLLDESGVAATIADESRTVLLFAFTDTAWQEFADVARGTLTLEGDALEQIMRMHAVGLDRPAVEAAQTPQGRLQAAARSLIADASAGTLADERIAVSDRGAPGAAHVSSATPLKEGRILVLTVDRVLLPKDRYGEYYVANPMELEHVSNGVMIPAEVVRGGDRVMRR